MPAARYWRIAGIDVRGSGGLELSEIEMYDNAGPLAGAISCSFVPSSGGLASLRDGSTSTAAGWLSSVFKQPGFWLDFDFGPSGADLTRIRLGASSEIAAFPKKFTLFHSDNNIDFVANRIVVSITPPGANALTVLTVVGGDSFAANVNVLLPMKGSVAEASRGANVTVFGSPIVGSDGITFDASSYLRVTGLQPFGTGDFTVESISSQTRSLSADPGNWQISSALSGLNPGYIGALSCLSTPGNDVVALGNGSAITTGFATGSRHLCVEKKSNITSFYVNGLLKGSASDAANYQGTVLAINGYYGTGYLGSGEHLGFRVTTGVARYGGEFTPPFMFVGGNSSLIPEDRSFSWNGISQAPFKFAGDEMAGYQLTLTTGVINYADAVNGGQARITGTVKEKNTPANTPLRRRVMLIEERSQVVIRKTWSDAVTGDYEFRGIAQNAVYTVVSYDHTGMYRAVIADAQTAV